MLRCFSTVAQTGNLLEASSRLGRTQSAISMTLKQLEDHLGDRLFESDRKNKLTPLGEQVFVLAQSQIAQFDETVRAMIATAKAPQGLIRIASVPSVAGLVFPRVIEAMADHHPELKIELRDADSEQISFALLHGHADIGVASGSFEMKEIRQTHLFSDRFGLICSPDHPLAGRERNPTIEEVTKSGFIKNNLCRLIETSAFHEAAETATITAHNTSSIIAMVRSSDWVTVLPESVVRMSPNNIIFREIEGLPDRRPVYLYLRESSPFQKFVVELHSMIKEINWLEVVGMPSY